MTKSPGRFARDFLFPYTEWYYVRMVNNAVYITIALLALGNLAVLKLVNRNSDKGLWGRIKATTAEEILWSLFSPAVFALCALPVIMMSSGYIGQLGWSIAYIVVWGFGTKPILKITLGKAFVVVGCSAIVMNILYRIAIEY